MFYLGVPMQGMITSDISLQDFSIVGAGSGLPSGPNTLYPNGLAVGVSLHGVNHFELTGLDISHIPAISVAVRGASNGVISNNDIHNSGRDGINASWWNSTNLTNLVISHNIIARVGDDGIDLDGTPGEGSTTLGESNRSALPTNLVISDNQISGWPSNVNGKALGRGIFLRSISNSRIVNNTVTDTFADGIMLRGSGNLAGDFNPADHAPWQSTNIQILDNRVERAGQLSTHSSLNIPRQHSYGIEIQDSTKVTLEGNTVLNSLNQNLHIASCTAACVNHNNRT